jgi:hypothetical protein
LLLCLLFKPFNFNSPWILPLSSLFFHTLPFYLPPFHISLHNWQCLISVEGGTYVFSTSTQLFQTLSNICELFMTQCRNLYTNKHKGTVDYFNYLRTGDSCLRNVLTKELKLTPQLTHTQGSWIQIQINPRIFHKIWNPFST